LRWFIRSDRGEKLTLGDRSLSGMSSNDGGGLMSSAGLVRYFDAEDNNAIRIDPKTVVAFGAFFGIFVQILNLIL
jgi:preprotein translocase subunit Sec61beta